MNLDEEFLSVNEGFAICEFCPLLVVGINSQTYFQKIISAISDQCKIFYFQKTSAILISKDSPILARHLSALKFKIYSIFSRKQIPDRFPKNYRYYLEFVKYESKFNSLQNLLNADFMFETKEEDFSPTENSQIFSTLCFSKVENFVQCFEALISKGEIWPVFAYYYQEYKMLQNDEKHFDAIKDVKELNNIEYDESFVKTLQKDVFYLEIPKERQTMKTFQQIFQKYQTNSKIIDIQKHQHSLFLGFLTETDMINMKRRFDSEWPHLSNAKFLSLEEARKFSTACPFDLKYIIFDEEGFPNNVDMIFPGSEFSCLIRDKNLFLVGFINLSTMQNAIQRIETSQQNEVIIIHGIINRSKSQEIEAHQVINSSNDVNKENKYTNNDIENNDNNYRESDEEKYFESDEDSYNNYYSYNSDDFDNSEYLNKNDENHENIEIEGQTIFEFTPNKEHYYVSFIQIPIPPSLRKITASLSILDEVLDFWQSYRSPIDQSIRTFIGFSNKEQALKAIYTIQHKVQSMNLIRDLQIVKNQEILEEFSPVSKFQEDTNKLIIPISQSSSKTKSPVFYPKEEITNYLVLKEKNISNNFEDKEYSIFEDDFCDIQINVIDPMNGEIKTFLGFEFRTIMAIRLTNISRMKSIEIANIYEINEEFFDIYESYKEKNQHNQQDQKTQKDQQLTSEISSQHSNSTIPNLFIPNKDLFYLYFEEHEGSRPSYPINDNNTRTKYGVSNIQEIYRSYKFPHNNKLFTFLGFNSKCDLIAAINSFSLRSCCVNGIIYEYKSPIITNHQENQTNLNTSTAHSNAQIDAKVEDNENQYSQFQPIDGLHYIYFEEYPNVRPSCSQQYQKKIFGISYVDDVQRSAVLPNENGVFTFLGFSSKSNLLAAKNTPSLRSASFNRKINEYNISPRLKENNENHYKDDSNDLINDNHKNENEFDRSHASQYENRSVSNLSYLFFEKDDFLNYLYFEEIEVPEHSEHLHNTTIFDIDDIDDIQRGYKLEGYSNIFTFLGFTSILRLGQVVRLLNENDKVQNVKRLEDIDNINIVKFDSSSFSEPTSDVIVDENGEDNYIDKIDELQFIAHHHNHNNDNDDDNNNDNHPENKHREIIRMECEINLYGEKDTLAQEQKNDQDSIISQQETNHLNYFKPNPQYFYIGFIENSPEDLEHIPNPFYGIYCIEDIQRFVFYEQVKEKEKEISSNPSKELKKFTFIGFQSESRATSIFSHIKTISTLTEPFLIKECKNKVEKEKENHNQNTSQKFKPLPNIFYLRFKEKNSQFYPGEKRPNPFYEISNFEDIQRFAEYEKSIYTFIGFNSLHKAQTIFSQLKSDKNLDDLTALYEFSEPQIIQKLKESNSNLFVPTQDIFYLYFEEFAKALPPYSYQDFKTKTKYGVKNIQEIHRSYQLSNNNNNHKLFTFLGFNSKRDLIAAMKVNSLRTNCVDGNLYEYEITKQVHNESSIPNNVNITTNNLTQLNNSISSNIKKIVYSPQKENSISNHTKEFLPKGNYFYIGFIENSPEDLEHIPNPFYGIYCIEDIQRFVFYEQDKGKEKEKYTFIGFQKFSRRETIFSHLKQISGIRSLFLFDFKDNLKPEDKIQSSLQNFQTDSVNQSKSQSKPNPTTDRFVYIPTKQHEIDQNISTSNQEIEILSKHSPSSTISNSNSYIYSSNPNTDNSFQKRLNQNDFVFVPKPNLFYLYFVDNEVGAPGKYRKDRFCGADNVKDLQRKHIFESDGRIYTFVGFDSLETFNSGFKSISYIKNHVYKLEDNIKLQQKLEQERQKRLEQERQQKLEQERIRQQKLEQERQKRLEQKRQKRLEQERQQKLEQERKKRLEQERQQKLEQERQKRLEQERQQKLEQERQKRLEQERQQKLEQERKKRLEQERQQKLEQERQKRLEQERQQKLEQERKKRLKQEQIRHQRFKYPLFRPNNDLFYFYFEERAEHHIDNKIIKSLYGVDTCVEIQKNFRVGSNSKIYTFMGFKSIIHMKKGIDVISQSLVAKSEIYIFKDSPKNIILFKWKLLLLSSFYFIKNKSRQVLRQVFIEIHGINTKKNQYFIRNPNYYYFMIYEDTFPSCITKYFNDMESIFPCAVDVQRNVIIEKCNLRITFVGFNRLELAISGMEIFKNFLTFREVKLFNKKANLHYINISENLVSPAILTQLFYFIKTFLPVRDIQRNVLYKSERISTLFGFDDLFITFVSFHKIEEFLSDQGYGDNDCDYKMNIFENQIFETSSDFEKAIEGIKYSSIQRNVTTFLENSQKFRNYQMLSTLINFDSNNEKNNALTKLNLRLFNNHAFTPKEDLYYCYFYEHKFSDIHPDHIEFVLEEFQGIKDFQRNVRSIENPYSATFIGFDDQQDAIDGLKDIKMTLKLAKFKKSESLEKRVNSRLPEFQKSKSIIWFRRFIILLLLSKLYFLYR